MEKKRSPEYRRHQLEQKVKRRCLRLLAAALPVDGQLRESVNRWTFREEFARHPIGQALLEVPVVGQRVYDIIVRIASKQPKHFACRQDKKQQVKELLAKVEHVQQTDPALRQAATSGTLAPAVMHHELAVVTRSQVGGERVLSAVMRILVRRDDQVKARLRRREQQRQQGHDRSRPQLLQLDGRRRRQLKRLQSFRRKCMKVVLSHGRKVLISETGVRLLQQVILCRSRRAVDSRRDPQLGSRQFSILIGDGRTCLRLVCHWQLRGSERRPRDYFTFKVSKQYASNGAYWPGSQVFAVEQLPHLLQEIIEQALPVATLGHVVNF